jgi:hypothetical protein
MEAIQVIDSTYLVQLPNGRTVMMGAAPETLKVLVLWEYPAPSTVILPPDPLYAEGMNQASFEFLLFNHMFMAGGLRDRNPFTVVCDPAQQTRVENLIRQMLRGPSDEEMARWRTPAAHRRQVTLETAVVSGEVAKLRLEQMAQVLAFHNGRVELPDGTRIENLPESGEVRIGAQGKSVVVPRRAQARAPLPFYFADVDTPVVGPRFGLQIIGSASGFSASEWSSCFIVWINGQPLIVDGTPHLDDHLRRLGIEDDHILGYLITHNHEDHANMVGQLVNRRPVTILTSPPVFASLVSRLSSILDQPEEEVRSYVRWVPLNPGLEGFGEPLHWFGAEIRAWYSVHTIPTLGLDIKMGERRIRFPGDTLWGRQLEPLLEQKVISRARYDLIQNTYDGADVIVADAGGGPIHPDPEEVGELVSHADNSRILVTHVPEHARPFLPSAEPGTTLTLIPRSERTPEDAMGLFGSPVLQHIPERWLLTLLYGGDILIPSEDPIALDQGALVVLTGSLHLRCGDSAAYPLQRGDVFHGSLIGCVESAELTSTAKWTRLLRIPETLFRTFLKETAAGPHLERIYRTRLWWSAITGTELGLDTIVALADLCRERHFRPGGEVVRQGDLANHFYVVTEGLVRVERRNGGEPRELGEFGPGFHFGELALLGRERRTATVRAVEPTRVLEVPARAFKRHLMGIPLARFRIYTEAELRLSTLRRPQVGEPHEG